MKKISEKILFEGKWLCLCETVYEDKDGVAIAWESVRRKKTVSGVVIVAKLMPSKRFIIIKQFRPAIAGYILSFPAGLSHGDPKHALVELKEETGYVGKIALVSPPMKTGASIIDDNGQIVYVGVDENDPANRNPVQQLEPGEVIEVHLVKKEEAKNFLLKENSRGTHISSNLWYFFVLSEMVLG